MIKPIEIMYDLGLTLIIGTYNFYLASTVLAQIPDSAAILKGLLNYSTSMTSIILVVYLLFRARKMYWDSQNSKYTAKKSKKELQQ